MSEIRKFFLYPENEDSLKKKKKNSNNYNTIYFSTQKE